MTIRVDDVRVDYGGANAALEGVSVEATQGRVVVLIGPNASGKTTLLKTMAGLQRPSRGTVTLDGEAIHAISPARRAARIAWMAQRPSITGRFSVRETVAIGRYARPFDPEAVENALVAADLQPYAEAIVEELSVGQQQRVAFARALAQVPVEGVLLLDEPFGPLDPAQVERAAQEVAARAKAGGTVVVAVHELRVARMLGEEVIGLREGRVEVSGSVEEVLDADAIERLYGVPSVSGPEGPLPALRL